MDNAAIVAGLMQGNRVFLFQNEQTAVRKPSQDFGAHGETYDSRADDCDIQGFVQRRVSVSETVRSTVSTGSWLPNNFPDLFPNG